MSQFLGLKAESGEAGEFEFVEGGGGAFSFEGEGVAENLVVGGGGGRESRFKGGGAENLVVEEGGGGGESIW